MRRLLLALSLSLAALCAHNAHAMSGADMESFRQLIEKGNSLMLHKQFSAAMATYQQALELDPDDPQARSIISINMSETQNHWGIQYYSQRNFKEAIAHFQAAVKINPKNTQAKRNIDLAQHAMERVARMTNDVSDDESHGSARYDEESVVGRKKFDEEGEPDNGLSVKPDSATRPKPDAHRTPPSHGRGEESERPKNPSKDVGDAFSTGTSGDLTQERQPPPSRDRSTSPRGGDDDFRSQAIDDFPASGKAQTPVASPEKDMMQSGAVLILTPGTKKMLEQQHAAEFGRPGGASSTYSTPPSQPSSPPVPTYPPAYAPSAAAPPPSNYGQPAPLPGQTGYHTANPTYSIVPKQFSDQPVIPMVVPNVGSPAPNVVAPAAAGSLDESLTAIEMNVMGRRQNDMTVLQRLEKIETMTDGQIRTGTVIERIDLLRKKYGL